MPSVLFMGYGQTMLTQNRRRRTPRSMFSLFAYKLLYQNFNKTEKSYPLKPLKWKLARPIGENLKVHLASKG